MARYIDADKIIYWIRYVSSNGLESDVRRVAFKDEIERMPTADVVPRSTIDEIFALIWDAFQSTHYDSEFEEKFDEIEKKYTEGNE